MVTPFDLGWGNPRDLTREDMVLVEIFPGRKVALRDHTVGLVMAELVRRLRRDGWDGPDVTVDEWGYARRLKRWAEALGHQLATAPLSEWSDHAWGTAVDLDTAVNPMLEVMPASPWQHTTMPRSSARIAAALGLDWGGTWTEPWDPQHFQVAVTPAELGAIAARIGDEEDLSVMDSQTKSYLDRMFDTVVDRLDLIRLGDDPDPGPGNTHPANLDTILQRIRALQDDVDAIKRRLDQLP
jgi:hypothetical protein